MESHRRGEYSGNGASEIEHGKSENIVNEIEVIGSNEGVQNGITISSDTKAKSLYERKAFQIGQPPNKRTRNSDGSEFVEEMSPNWDVFKVEPTEEQVKSNEMSQHFTTEKGSVYGENGYYIREESLEERKSEAICLVPGSESNFIPRSPNWKTRMCYKWELNGWCAYGDGCRFAHGSSELRGYYGLTHKETVNPRYTFDAKKTPFTAATCSTGDGHRQVPRVPVSNRVGVTSRRLPTTVELPTRKWKGPDKISKIYGDWIDDLN